MGYVNDASRLLGGLGGPKTAPEWPRTLPKSSQTPWKTMMLVALRQAPASPPDFAWLLSHRKADLGIQAASTSSGNDDLISELEFPFRHFDFMKFKVSLFRRKEHDRFPPKVVRRSNPDWK